MKRFVFFAVVLLAAACGKKNAQESTKMITPVRFSDVTIYDEFWLPRLQAHKNVTLEVCMDQIENQTGRIRNFENAARH